MEYTVLTKADAESAYGSETTSISDISDRTVKKETFSIQEPTNSREKCCQYRNYGQITDKRGQYHNYGQIAVKGIIGFILIFLLINSYRMSSKVDETLQIVSNLQTQFDKLPKGSVGENSEFQETESFEKENEKMIEKLSETLKEVKPFLNKEEVKNGKKNSPHKVNSASYMFGASVDTSYSSSSDLSGESDLVLLDRPDPPANRAWCSDENEPILTVNLANYIKPTAVSYQHFKWNGTVPHGSPRVFNVFACLDFYCEKTELLISNCEYKSSGQIQEQIYQIPSHSKTKSIGKVQFRFLKNHGNVKKTCVSLVRVYRESEVIPKMREDQKDKNGRTCSNLRNDYHNSPFYYDKYEYKTCGILFSKGCCSVCPECCDECYIESHHDFYIISTILVSSLGIFCVLSLLKYLLIRLCSSMDHYLQRDIERQYRRRIDPYF